MTAPDRIALRWELGAAVTSGPLMDHPDYTQYVRADLAYPAPLAEALAVPEVAALVEALEWIIALNDQAECCGKDYAECCNQPEYGLDRAQRVSRNALAALRAIGEGKA